MFFSGSWCVGRFSQFSGRFNRAIVFIHHIVPFILQLICGFVVIVLIARKRASATGGTAVHLFRGYLVTHKDLFIPACFIILSALPQFIISFSLACTDFNQAWQRYSLTVAYFLSFTPQTLTYVLYIRPSSLFKEEFANTRIGCKWLGKGTKSKQIQPQANVRKNT